MSEISVLLIYIILIPIMPLLGGIIILAMAEKSNTEINIVSIAIKLTTLFIAITAAKSLFFSASDDQNRINYVVKWLNISNGDLFIFFSINKTTIMILIFLIIISLIIFVDNAFDLTSSNMPKDAKSAGISSIFDACVFFSLISGSLAQIAIFVITATFAGYVMLLEKCENEEERKGMNIALITNMAADYMILCAAMLLTSSSYDKIFGSNAVLAVHSIKPSYTNLAAFGMLLSGLAVKMNFVPFCFIYFIQKKKLGAEAAKIISFLSAALPLYVLYAINPLTIHMPKTYLIFFASGAVITGIILCVYAIYIFDIFKITLALSFCNISLTALCLIQGKADFIECLISSSTGIIAISLLLASKIRAEFRRNVLVFLNAKTSKIIIALYSAYILAVSGVPPFSSYIRNMLTIQTNLNFIFISLICFSAFLTSFAVSKVIMLISSNFFNKRTTFTSSFSTGNIISIVCIAAFFIISELNAFGVYFGYINFTWTNYLCIGFSLAGFISAAPIYFRIRKKSSVKSYFRNI